MSNQSYVSVRLRFKTYQRLLRVKAFLIAKEGKNLGLADTIDALIDRFDAGPKESE